MDPLQSDVVFNNAAFRLLLAGSYRLSYTEAAELGGLGQQGRSDVHINILSLSPASDYLNT
jgi:hypothetical protein